MVEKMEETIGSVEAEAKKRRERILQLKRKAANAEKTEETGESEAKLPKPLFRNYQPEDESLKEKALLPAKPANVEEQVKDQLNDIEAPIIAELDLNKLAPRKIDWDLKRDIEKKLEKLQRRTNKAIAELIRERIKSEHLLSIEPKPEN